MELLQLRYFCDAARLENFSKVAEKYYVPQSSISHTIARLEDELGVKLFTRSGRKVMLNACGRAFYAEVSVALDKIRIGTERVDDLRHNSIRLALFEGTVAVIPIIAAFQKKYPDISVTFSNPSDRLRGNLFYDVRVSTRPYVGEEKDISLPLFEERMMVAVAKTSPLAEQKSVTLEEIRDLPVIGLYQGEKVYRLMHAHFELHEYKPNIIIETNNHSAVAEFVSGGFGVAFYPEISWADAVSDKIASLPFSDIDCRRTVYISYPKENSPSDAVQKFIDFAIDYFKEKSRS